MRRNAHTARLYYQGCLHYQFQLLERRRKGREAELQALHQWLEQALQGRRQVGFVTGEAGIGKTTVVDAFLGTITDAAPLRVAWGQYLAQYSTGEAYQDPAQRLRVVRGLSGVHTIRAELRQAWELCEEYLRLATDSQGSGLLLDGHQHLGQILYWCGDFIAAWAHLEQAIVLSTRPRPHSVPRVSPYDPGVGGQSYAALVLWGLGYPEQALHQSRAALSLAQELSHPFSLAWALHFTAVLHCHRSDVQEVGVWSAKVLTLAHEQGFAQRVATGTTLQGWALAVQGQHAEGMARLQQGLAAYRAT